MSVETLGDIIGAIESKAPRELQESYDNTGWQLLAQPGGAAAECTGVMTCVDATEAIVAEAADEGCNLLLTHHPVLFRGQKSFTGATQVQRVIMEAMRRGVSIYSCHTAVDSAPGGVSATIASRIGLEDVEVLSPLPGQPDAGLGAIGNLPAPGLMPGELAERVKGALGSPMVRCTRPAQPLKPLLRVALCGGSGSEFIDLAVAKGAEAYITSDVKHHDFVDHAPDIFIIDVGHYEAEACTKDIFHHAITEIFPNFAVKYSLTEKNPIIYL